MRKYVLHDDRGTQWIMFGRDPGKNDTVIDTNEYLIICGEESMLLDPGGTEIFPTVLTAVSDVVDVTTISAFLCSHQDPDIMSSLPLWLGLTPKAKIYLSWLWSSFVAHFGNEYAGNFVTVADEGGTLELGGRSFELVPAHYCHSPGNIHLYDSEAGILFSGDVGAALLPIESPVIVEDFAAHIKYMETFHRRWMPSNEAKSAWVRRVRRLAPRMICPQHGSVFQGDNVGRFLDWFEELDVGVMRKRA